MVWIPGTVNRIQNVAAPNNPIFVLFLFHALFTPLQGFFNFLVYSFADVGPRIQDRLLHNKIEQRDRTCASL